MYNMKMPEASSQRQCLHDRSAVANEDKLTPPVIDGTHHNICLAFRESCFEEKLQGYTLHMRETDILLNSTIIVGQVTHDSCQLDHKA